MLKSKGGYAIVDCKGLDLTKGSTPQTINGLFARIKEVMPSGKPLLGYNCIWGSGVPVTPIYFFAIQYDTNTIICTASTLQIYITNEDVVTIVNMVE